MHGSVLRARCLGVALGRFAVRVRPLATRSARCPERPRRGRRRGVGEGADPPRRGMDRARTATMAAAPAEEAQAEPSRW